jgi:hypothetical protein
LTEGCTFLGLAAETSIINENSSSINRRWCYISRCCLCRLSCICCLSSIFDLHKPISIIIKSKILPIRYLWKILSSSQEFDFRSLRQRNKSNDNSNQADRRDNSHSD